MSFIQIEIDRIERANRFQQGAIRERIVRAALRAENGTAERDRLNKALGDLDARLLEAEINPAPKRNPAVRRERGDDHRFGIARRVGEFSFVD